MDNENKETVKQEDAILPITNRIKDWRVIYFTVFTLLSCYVFFFGNKVTIVIDMPEMLSFPYLSFVVILTFLSKYLWVMGIFGIIFSLFRHLAKEFYKSYLIVSVIFLIGLIIRLIWL